MDSSSYPADLALDVNEVPMSRTHQYRKVMKPLLERKRRARINKCLDELKDLMVDALQSEGESIAKLEKADVLELTVRHLQKLKRQQRLRAEPDRYASGFSACATEVGKCLASFPGVEPTVGAQLMGHLGHQLKGLQGNTTPAPAAAAAPLTVSLPPAAAAPVHKRLPSADEPMDLKISSPHHHSDGGYSSGRESVSPRSSLSSPPMVKREVASPPAPPPSDAAVWRPF